MTKKEFLSALEKGLCTLPENDVERSIEYYREMIDDRMENGQTEAEAVAAMGDVREIISQILAESPQKSSKPKGNRSLSPWAVALIILGSPIWASLLISAAVIVFSAYVVIWSLVISLYAVVFSFAAVAACGVFIAVMSAVSGSLVKTVFYIGIALFFAGASGLLFFAAGKAGALTARFSAFTAKGIWRTITRKAE